MDVKIPNELCGQRPTIEVLLISEKEPRSTRASRRLRFGRSDKRDVGLENGKFSASDTKRGPSLGALVRT